jgi:pimeloyl-ACP methyl ester carboxylesterase
VTGTRAALPDDRGYVERDGVRVFWERYGDGEPTILFLPTWTIIHSRCWKAQIPYLARHCRVLTFDPRGNGRSDRPPHPAAYAEREFAADALDVMDATKTERAILVSLSKGAQRALLLAAEHPERVDGAAFIGPFFPVSAFHGLRWRLMVHPRLRRALFMRPPVATGWLKFNGAYWRSHYRDFVEWFMRRACNTPHSTKQLEDAIEWGLETDAETLISSVLGDLAAPATRRDQSALARRVRCPVLVVSAPNDKITAHADAKALAAATGGELLSIPDGGHTPQARKPVRVNLALRDFAQRAFTADSRELRGATTVG